MPKSSAYFEQIAEVT